MHRSDCISLSLSLCLRSIALTLISTIVIIVREMNDNERTKLRCFVEFIPKVMVGKSGLIWKYLYHPIKNVFCTRQFTAGYIQSYNPQAGQGENEFELLKNVSNESCFYIASICCKCAADLL
jgi:hypothetical protein